MEGEAGKPAASETREIRFPLLHRALPLLLGFLTVTFVLAVKTSAFSSFDTYFHLRFGDEFLGEWSIREPGQVGTSGSAEWLPTQWLSQISMAWTWSHLGSTGFSVAFIGLVAAVLAGVYVLARTRCGPLPAALIAFAAAVGTSPWLSARPQLLGMGLMIIVVAGWNAARRTARPPWWLIPVVWVWAMCHGTWVLGIAASAILAVGVFLEHRPEPGSRRLPIVPIAMIGASLVTPIGPALATAAIEVSSRSDHFQEWGPPDYSDPLRLPATILIGSTFLLAAIRRETVGPFDAALLIAGGGLALYSDRTVPFAVIVLVPLTAELWSRLPRRSWSGIEAGALALAVLTLMGSAAAGRVSEPGISADLTPLRSEIDALAAETPVLTDRGYGSALMWTHPDLDILVHGYGDVFTDAELTRLDDMLDLQPGWDETVADLGAEVAVLPEDSALAYALPGIGWSLVETTDEVAYLTAPAATQRANAD